MLADGFSGVDALTASCGEVGHAYVIPPVGKLVGKVVQPLAEQQAGALLIVQEWPAQRWWPVLMERAAMGSLALEL
jgi:hypothetical protein